MIDQVQKKKDLEEWERRLGDADQANTSYRDPEYYRKWYAKNKEKARANAVAYRKRVKMKRAGNG